MLIVGIGGAFGVLRAADEVKGRTQRVDNDQVERVGGSDAYLADNNGPAENFLLVGVDSREGFSDDDRDIGTVGDVQSQLADTIMILRREKGGGASLVSIPRDLWVEIPGEGGGKINSAYRGGVPLVSQTITESLGIPIHHHVEIDLYGFRELVDELDGVEMEFEYAARDERSGLDVQPGVQVLDGSMALAYARSRYYQEWRDGDWQQDPRADLGRIERQQRFVSAAVDQTLGAVRSDPYSMGRLVDAVIGAVVIDQRLDPLDAAGALRAAAEDGFQPITLPVYGDEAEGQSIVRLSDEAEPTLNYFRGTAPNLPAQENSPEEQ